MANGYGLVYPELGRDYICGNGSWGLVDDGVLQPENAQYVAYNQHFTELAAQVNAMIIAFFSENRAYDHHFARLAAQLNEMVAMASLPPPVPNPFPPAVTICEQCQAIGLNSLYSRGKHQRMVHKIQYAYPCGVEACEKVYDTIMGRSLHVNRFHINVPNTCNICPYDSSCEVLPKESPPLPHHLWQHLQYTFRCPYLHENGSTKSCANLANMRSHLSQKHPEKSLTMPQIIALYMDPSTDLPYGATLENNFLQGQEILTRSV